MYKTFFGLQASPFADSPDPRYLFMTPHAQEALACLEHGLSARKGFTVLTGEVGTGKTTLLRCALNLLKQQRVSTAFVFNPRLNVLDFLEFVLTDFGIPLSSSTKSGMLLQLNYWLVARFAAKETCILVIDEAQNLSWELLEEVRLLTNLETSSQKLLQIVLAGQPELAERLHHPIVRQLRQRVSLWCRTEPLTADQTHGYVAERLRISGATSPLFSSESLDLVHSYSGGIPRVINLLCEHALLAAYVDQIPQVPKWVIEMVAAELELAPQRMAAASSFRTSHTSQPMAAGINRAHYLPFLDNPSETSSSHLFSQNQQTSIGAENQPSSYDSRRSPESGCDEPHL
jgi:general secretion pathway protein A